MKTETKKYLKIGVIALILYLIAQNWLIVAGAFTTVLSAASPLIVGGVITYPRYASRRTAGGCGVQTAS